MAPVSWPRIAFILYSQSLLLMRLSQVGRIRNKRSSHSNSSHQRRRHKSKPQSIIVYQPSA